MRLVLDTSVAAVAFGLAGHRDATPAAQVDAAARLLLEDHQLIIPTVAFAEILAWPHLRKSANKVADRLRRTAAIAPFDGRQAVLLADLLHRYGRTRSLALTVEQVRIDRIVVACAAAADATVVTMDVGQTEVARRFDVPVGSPLDISPTPPDPEEPEEAEPSQVPFDFPPRG